jgi:SpoVK/Ycf46/Vps4 family AAA+-type ATPase
LNEEQFSVMRLEVILRPILLSCSWFVSIPLERTSRLWSFLAGTPKYYFICCDSIDCDGLAPLLINFATCREVQRILMELLNQMDGFDQTVNVKVIMATNRADTLDPALLRPGRLDRKIEFPLPDRRQKRLVFQVSFDMCTFIIVVGGQYVVY